MTSERLTQLIVWYASRQGTKLSPIRLVKLLYLADLYSARVRGGKTLTDWPWRFHHYGPFCVESLRAVDAAVASGLIATETFASKFRDEDAKLYVFPRDDEDTFDVDDAERDLPLRVTSPLKAALKKWGDDTYALLDHVYFETEPMLDARPGDVLDFSTARIIVTTAAPPEQKPGKSELALGRELVARLAAKAQAPRQRFATPGKFFDEAYNDSLRRMDDNHAVLPDFDGTSTIET